ncbi:MetQ/NlpA family ABC transporter substrate-binding protein [uncultured Faecalibaculum sp.]|uniref:MetQ/NlpA family ABC transporter substrate-binding protein n=1 Tax=uncultured Faecalibaculum sp. TaxID=1729681 RepID=UPI00260D2B1A|nr:MetQ/NlpA family ABC transporter substrate-binding protein [uncultured Faecalibaculum sp.]
MNKLAKLAAAALLAAGLAGCSSTPAESEDAGNTDELEVVKVGATTAPHAMILEQAVEPMKEAGYDLQITEFSDYPNINPSTSDGSLDANYFQHSPYLEGYNEDNGYKSGDDGYLVSAGAIHYEPLGAYAQEIEEVNLDNIPENAKIAVPNDATNEARALLLLQDLGIITLKDGAGLNATKADVAENPKNVEIIESAADQTANQLPDVDVAIVNGNYALAANITEYLRANESSDSEAAQTYQNVVAVKESNKDKDSIKKLVEILKSDDIKKYIEDEFGVSVVPAA